MKTKAKGRRQKAEGTKLPYEYPGVCHVCGCTSQDGCAEGCEWVDRRQMLCSACDALSAEERFWRRREAAAELQERASEASFEADQAIRHLVDVSRRLAALTSKGDA